MTKKLYMLVTYDRYEFPIIIADSAEELARKCGVKRNTIYHMIRRQQKGCKSQYVCVEIDEEEEE